VNQTSKFSSWLASVEKFGSLLDMKLRWRSRVTSFLCRNIDVGIVVLWSKFILKGG
jgi:hypothetical protein